MRVTISVFGRFHAFSLASELQKHGCLDRLISTYPAFEIKKYGIANEATRSIVSIELLARAWQRTPAGLKGNRNLQFWFHEKYDLAAQSHISSESNIFVGWSSSSLYSLRRAKKLGATTVVERCSSHIVYQTEILREEYARWGLQFTATHPGVYERELQEYAEADKIAIPSHFVKRTFLDKGVAQDKLLHVPYGVSLKKFYPVHKEDNVFRVIHCGGISLRKGVQYLLRAFYELNLPNAELWLVGSLSPEMQPFLAKYQSDRIIIKGKQPQSQLHWFFSQCSVFCLASLEEGLAYVQAEAMACGLPVIHTTNTGGEDIVRNGIDGFCIPIRDVEAIKEKILFFYENPEKRVEMARNALQQANNSLSWHDYGERIIAKYGEAINNTKLGLA